MLESLKRLNGGTIHMPSRIKDRPDRERLAIRFERFKAVA
jgi:putative restriction endonuclease